ncbi:hypothetical protein U9M48_036243, partial [Paspalum notatum var. saurae]
VEQSVEFAEPPPEFFEQQQDNPKEGKCEVLRMRLSWRRVVPPSSRPFDLCPGYDESMMAKPTMPQGPEKRTVGESSTDATSVQHLRPGFIKPEDQVQIVRMCRQLGNGPGGFYRPSLKDGAKLNLWMMSLGKNWDPITRSYGPTRPFDGARAPAIPDAFKMIAQTANSTSSEFPQIKPDICIINYYTNSGKLGLHQDKDESKRSLNQGLPFISISIGDTAEFLFSDTRDKDKATKVNLKS